MRALGLVLLLGGFLWLAWDCFGIGPIARATMDIQMKELGAPSDSVFLRQDQAASLIGSTIRKMSELLPNFMLPGFAMLAGGLVLFISGRGRGPALGLKYLLKLVLMGAGALLVLFGLVTVVIGIVGVFDPTGVQMSDNANALGMPPGLGSRLLVPLEGILLSTCGVGIGFLASRMKE